MKHIYLSKDANFETIVTICPASAMHNQWQLSGKFSPYFSDTGRRSIIPLAKLYFFLEDEATFTQSKTLILYEVLLLAEIEGPEPLTCTVRQLCAEGEVHLSYLCRDRRDSEKYLNLISIVSQLSRNPQKLVSCFHLS